MYIARLIPSVKHIDDIIMYYYCYIS